MDVHWVPWWYVPVWLIINWPLVSLKLLFDSEYLTLAERSVVEFHKLWTPAVCIHIGSRTPHSISWHYLLSDVLDHVPQTTSSLHCCLSDPLGVCGSCPSQMPRDTRCWHMLLDQVMDQVRGLRDSAVMWTSWHTSCSYNRVQIRQTGNGKIRLQLLLWHTVQYVLIRRWYRW